LHGRFPETIELGSQGKTVEMWQLVVGIDPPDGAFGPITDARTRSWQSAHGIDPDGVVGPLTWTAAMKTVGKAGTPRTGGAPAGTRPLPQSVANQPAITAFAIETLNNPVAYPMGSTNERTVNGVQVVARIEPHTWTHRAGKLVTNLNPPIRGVTLYQRVDDQVGNDPVVWRVSEHGGEYSTKTDQGGNMMSIGDDFNSRPAGFMAPVGNEEAGSQGEHGCPSDIRGPASKYRLKR
jgi:hypothetical protein